ncbi:MAG: hypothetical protein KC431_05375 [Myxococcales bacterium]|nr:hypothetical protein [Myxococcales bacterium]
MRRLPCILMALGLVACGPGSVANDDDIGDSGETGSSDGTDFSDSSGTDDTGTSETETTSETDTTSETGTSETTGDTDTTGDTNGDGPPECQGMFTVIEGDLVIDAITTPEQLAALLCVEEITGDLTIEHSTLTDLDVFPSLHRVGGQLEIGNNNQLMTMAGLDGLAEVGSWVWIHHNFSLASLEGLGGLKLAGGLLITGNVSLVSLAGLIGPLELQLPFPGASWSPFDLHGNDNLASLDGLATLQGLSADVPVSISIVAHPVLGGDMGGFVGLLGDLDLGLYIHDNHFDSLEGLEELVNVRDLFVVGPGGDNLSLAGLDNLSTVSGTLAIGRCQYIDIDYYEDEGLMELDNVDGLGSLTEVGALEIWGNRELSNLDGMTSLSNVGSLYIEGNPKLPQSEAMAFAAGLMIEGNQTVLSNGTGQTPICGFVPW